MSLGVSMLLLVVGAILTFAVDVTTSGFSLHTVGIILMAAGASAWWCRCCSGAASRPTAGVAPWWMETRSWRNGASGATSRSDTPHAPHQGAWPARV